MAEVQTTIIIETKDLLGKVTDYFSEGYRLVQICAVKLQEHIELNYSFDKDYKFVNLRLIIQPEDEIQSISRICWSSFIYENEIHDLYGIKIKNINIDYKGKFYRTEVKAAFSKLEGAAAPKKDTLSTDKE
jgi:ech hydrogenase subunit D